jgi:hypothetical protein
MKCNNKREDFEKNKSDRGKWKGAKKLWAGRKVKAIFLFEEVT